MTLSLAALREDLPALMPLDQRRLDRRAQRAASLRDPAARERAVSELAGELAAAKARVQARRDAVPVITYPAELPVSQRKDEIAAAIRDHQVVIVAGETGSGKTTQLPKICLELGRGITGQIGHTQPRRIAARTVAERIAAELGTELGDAIGYKVRFADTSSDSTLVKVMTDGILLTELQRDRDLLRYDTLIIDEAHERSLNVDFILGYLKKLLPRRPDLKLIITSATIDPERFADHFAGGESNGQSAGGESGGQSAGGESSKQSGGPLVEVSGRTYPVEVRYRPLADPDNPKAEPIDQAQGILDAVDELSAEGPGDILVFLSGEREIRDTADALTDQETRRGRRGGLPLEVLPLYARLSAAEQYKVFGAHSGRRVVLATNIAETSLTVPGIKYVIDPGTARISRYSNRTKVQRLPIEPISQASANQRKGRCGRTSDGVCIRLYSEEDFLARPEFTDPEILRTSLASVILQMAALGLGEIADMPFIDPPEARNVTDGVRLLEELGALAPSRGQSRLTDTGRKLARLPLDPRLGRMILEADRNGVIAEVLIITAALAIQDPRERPADERDAADAMHRRFAEPGSDFLAFLTLWDYLRDRQKELSSSAFRRLCRREYLHFLRVREWQDVHGQLRQAAKEIGIDSSGRRTADDAATEPPRGRAHRRKGRGNRSAPEGTASATTPSDTASASPALGSTGGQSSGRGADGKAEPEGRVPAEVAELVHKSLLSGLLSHIGVQEEPVKQKPGQGKPARRRGPAEFAGARAAKFAIFPDSSLARKAPQWVMAAELVETSRLWARTVAAIQPEWAEPLAAHLVKRTYSEPRWDAKRGAAMASEKVTLYGLPLVAARAVNYANVDPAAARDLFIQNALVEGDWQTHHPFFHQNRELLDEAEDLERKARRRGIVVDDTVLFEFYDRRIPADVTSARHFDSWWKSARTADPGLLTFDTKDLLGPAAEEIQPSDYPEAWGELPLSYEFAPGAPEDGVTADIPLAVLNQVNDDELCWQVPGLREELFTELIRSLPKQLRTAFVPAPNTAREVVGRLGPTHGDLLTTLAAELTRISGVRVSRDDFDLTRLPAHLRMTFRVVDGDRVLATGKDLGALREELQPRLEAAINQAARGLTRTGLRDWTIGTLPRVFTHGEVQAYPALADAGDSADVRLFGTEAEAVESMRRGTRRLVMLQVPSGVRSIAGRLPVAAKLAMSRHPYPNAAAELDDCVACAADQVISDAGGPAWDEAGFRRLVEAARERLAVDTARVLDVVADVLGAAHEAEIALLTNAGGPPVALEDMRAQYATLIHPGFITETGLTRLPQLVRYLKGIARRIEKIPESIARDAERMATVHRVAAAYEETLLSLPPAARHRDDVAAVPWMIEELRVSLFAQTLGTQGPVSEKRIYTALDRLTDH
ncbi:MAG TPA: ATP-dependent RNA helicase HrpA [Streptosporangiaceae bacterium]